MRGPATQLAARLVPQIGSSLRGQPPLGELLLSKNRLTAGDLAEALSDQTNSGRRLGSILIEAGLIDGRVLAQALSEQFKIPTVDLRRETPDPEALAKINESVARDHRIVPLRWGDGVLLVAIADPLDDNVRDALMAVDASEVHVYIAPAEDIATSLNTAYRALSALDEQVRQFQATAPTVAVVAQEAVSQEDAPVVAIVNKIVTQALRDRASDIHLEPTDGRMRVRFRIDGALHEVLSLPSTMGPALVSRIKIMSDMNIVERRRPQDGQFQMDIDGHDLDVRVATTATIWGEKAVLRLLDKSRTLMRLSDLGMPSESGALYRSIVHKPFGMVLCTGPTGSGKTTTLYATLQDIARNDLNVMTIEDPVEYVFPAINQMQINVQADVTFASGLKSILRQDPDVILVGEVRDAETARIAVQSALTGHLVMSSLHATDSAAALVRLLDMGIEPFLVASSVVGVVAQRLVRRICPSCIEAFTPSASELAWYEFLDGPSKDKWFTGVGCNYCSGTGYRERIGVYEILEVTDEIRHALVSGAAPDEVRQLAKKQGMQSLADAAVQLVAADVTTVSEIIRTVYVA
ncbi:MAG: GspE/PulE family protein [Acidimicrobiia bacterium]